MNDDKTVQDEEKKLPESSNEIDTAPTTEIAMPEDKVAVNENPAPTEVEPAEVKNLSDDQDAQEEVAVDHSGHSHSSVASGDSEVPATWIKLVNGKFTCSECENEVEPETNTIEGVVKADLDQIKADLKLYPTKVVYGICPVCGMEFVFRLKGDDLYLEPSDLEK